MIDIRQKIAGIPAAHSLYDCFVHGVVRSGILDICHSLTGRQHVILTFHRIRPAGLPADPFDTCPSVPVETFRQVLSIVKSRFTVVSLSELCEKCLSRAPFAVITFDDGWRDNYDLAFPILRELKLPATIFITTDKIGSSTPFWQQFLGQIFRQAVEKPESPEAKELRNIFNLPASRALTSKLFRETVFRFKRTNGQVERERCLTRLRMTFLDCKEDARRFLSAEEIREMNASCVSFGSHTATHAILPQLRQAEVTYELTRSRIELQDILGHDIDMIAYPDGQYSNEVLKIARESGYRIGCTTRSGRIAIADDKLKLRRVELSLEQIDNLSQFSQIDFQWQTS